MKSFDVAYVSKLIKNDLGLFWDDLEVMRDNFTEFASNDQSCVQWPILSPMTSFDVDVINVCFPCVN